MVKLRYQNGDIKFQHIQHLDSSKVSTWSDLKNHISSLSSKNNPLTFIHILEGLKIVVASNEMSERETIEWSNLNITLWDAVKAEIEVL